MKKEKKKEFENRRRILNDNVLTETWMNQYQAIFDFFNMVGITEKGTKYFRFSNQEYVKTYNDFETLKLLQLRVEENETLDDWFTEFTHEITEYLSLVFDKSKEDFNAYDIDKVKDESMTYFIDVGTHLKEIEIKYFGN